MWIEEDTNMRAFVVAGVFVAFSSVALAQEVQVFYTDFDSGLAPEITGVASIESVQGFAGLGNTGNIFSGNLLRNDAVNGATVITLTNLPTHEAISISFLLAVLDSWDSINGSRSPDYFNVIVDGVTVFQTTFAQASGNVNYQPPAGGLIAPLANRGWNSSWGDAGYDMSFEPALSLIPHTASTVVVQIVANGAGYQGGNDESFGIDNLSISVTIPTPGSLVGLAGLGLVGLRRRR
ncbi:MAG: hypothetical protein KJZ65_12570 [Phycisphaerales bacterium]|nr:hypothetical protein [Phycisphaerales bacterium]